MSSSSFDAGTSPDHDPDQRRLHALIEAQPQSIRALIETLRAAPFPMFLLLGAERNIVYNQAYLPILGPHHPGAAGRPFFDVWPEVRDAIGPVIDRAFAGEASLFEDLPVVLHRSHTEPAWFTFSYSPVRDDSGTVVGALCVCTETTEAVSAPGKKFMLPMNSATKRFRGRS